MNYEDFCKLSMAEQVHELYRMVVGESAGSPTAATSTHPPVATSTEDIVILGQDTTTSGGPGKTDYRFTGDPNNVTKADVDKYQAAGSPDMDADGNVLDNKGVPTKLYAGGSFPPPTE